MGCWKLDYLNVLWITVLWIHNFDAVCTFVKNLNSFNQRLEKVKFKNQRLWYFLQCPDYQCPTTITLCRKCRKRKLKMAGLKKVAWKICDFWADDHRTPTDDIFTNGEFHFYMNIKCFFCLPCSIRRLFMVTYKKFRWVMQLQIAFSIE